MESTTRTRKLNITSDYIEAGELANEIGKFYMEDLKTAFENGRKHKKDKLYFIIKTEKDPSDHLKVYIRIGITDKKLEYLQESIDLWEYDYINDKQKLLWSIPHRTDMKNFLAHPEKYTKEIIGWIRKFLDQNPNINLKDKSGIILF